MMPPLPKPTEVAIPLPEVEGDRRYQFVVDAANIVKTMTARLATNQWDEPYPYVLQMEDDDYLHVQENEIRHVRLCCQSCHSAMFIVKKDAAPICFDCGEMA